MDLGNDHRDPPRWWGSQAQTRDVGTRLRDIAIYLGRFVCRHRVGALAALAALAVDQAAKHWVAWTLAIGESWPQQGPFQLTHVANTGGAYSLFSGHTVGLIVFSAIGLGVLFVLYWPHPKTGLRAQLSFGLMIAGMTGNLVDRVVFGHVIDFIDVVPWFIFNIADAAILMGIVLFACDVPTGRMFSRQRL